MKITGADQLAKRLRALGNAMSQQVVREALTKAAEPMRATMGQLAPRSAEAPHLADSMTISTAKPEDGVGVAVAVGPSRDFFYGRFLEFGTKKMSARPFMRPAFDQQAEKALEILQRQLWAEVSAAAATGGDGTL